MQRADALTGRVMVSRSRAYVLAASGYSFGIAYMSFFGHLKNASDADPSGIAPAVVIPSKVLGSCCRSHVLPWGGDHTDGTKADRMPPGIPNSMKSRSRLPAPTVRILLHGFDAAQNRFCF